MKVFPYLTSQEIPAKLWVSLIHAKAARRRSWKHCYNELWYSHVGNN